MGETAKKMIIGASVRPGRRLINMLAAASLVTVSGGFTYDVRRPANPNPAKSKHKRPYKGSKSAKRSSRKKCP